MGMGRAGRKMAHLRTAGDRDNRDLTMGRRRARARPLLTVGEVYIFGGACHHRRSVRVERSTIMITGVV